MPRKDLIAIAFLGLLIDPALADLQGARADVPTFTGEETAVIGQSAALSGLLRSDPWIVRKLLDAIGEVRSGSLNPPPSLSLSGKDDPELEQIQRSSPEAIHDLFQLLKQAGGKKPDKAK